LRDGGLDDSHPHMPMKLFRAVSLIEGLSWLLLLFIAMPLKYGLGRPEAVAILGRAHGVLFVLFILALGWVAAEGTWKLSQLARAFVASLIPFGAFWLEWTLRREEQRGGDVAA
jgi:integral membrane protein